MILIFLRGDSSLSNSNEANDGEILYKSPFIVKSHITKTSKTKTKHKHEEYIDELAFFDATLLIPRGWEPVFLSGRDSCSVQCCVSADGPDLGFLVATEDVCEEKVQVCAKSMNRNLGLIGGCQMC
jgi:hypothetical protein